MIHVHCKFSGESLVQLFKRILLSEIFAMFMIYKLFKLSKYFVYSPCLIHISVNYSL